MAINIYTALSPQQPWETQIPCRPQYCISWLSYWSPPRVGHSWFVLGRTRYKFSSGSTYLGRSSFR